LRQVVYGDCSDRAVDLYSAVITSVLYDFNAGDGAGLEVSEHGFPVVRRPVAEAEGYACVGLAGGSFATQGVRRAVEEMLERLVEAPQAAESGCECDFGHRHSGFVYELLGEENAAGLRDGDWGSSEMLMEEPAELAFADAEAFGQGFHGSMVAVKGAVGDESQGAGDGVGSSTP
jgi:hypothetical protein